MVYPKNDDFILALNLATLQRILALQCSKLVSWLVGGGNSVVVSGVGLINKGNRHWARLVLGTGKPSQSS